MAKSKNEAAEVVLTEDQLDEIDMLAVQFEDLPDGAYVECMTRSIGNASWFPEVDGDEYDIFYAWLESAGEE